MNARRTFIGEPDQVAAPHAVLHCGVPSPQPRGQTCVWIHEPRRTTYKTVDGTNSWIDDRRRYRGRDALCEGERRRVAVGLKNIPVSCKSGVVRVCIGAFTYRLIV